jgi:hypothetical protein
MWHSVARRIDCTTMLASVRKSDTLSNGMSLSATVDALASTVDVLDRRREPEIAIKNATGKSPKQ